MSTFEEYVEALCGPASASRTLPGVVLVANDSTGKRIYQQEIGTTSVDPAKSRPLTQDSIFWVASCTKLIASIGVLQLVERGLISLDDEVTKTCPELVSPQILQSFDDTGRPELRRATGTIRIRHLLTHTSGMAQDFLSPAIAKWWQYQGENPAEFRGDILKLAEVPLIAEPGTEWNYSPGLDWAGLIAARVTGEEGLGSYARKYIWEPLGIKDAAFRQKDLGVGPDELALRWAWMTQREQTPEGKIVPSEHFYPLDPKDEWGGGALYTSPAEYMKVLTSLLRNDGKLLKPSTVSKYVFEPEFVDGKVGRAAQKSLLKVLATHRAKRMFSGGQPAPDPYHPNGNGGDVEYQHGLLGLLTRKRGETQWSLSWSGLPNLFWWVSPNEGLCGMYASQLIPPGDALSVDLATMWRTEMEAKHGKSAAQSQ
ncbi:hypothetical protein LTS15_004615 [Exophiala xenobiotica]|nr:hypothetical protein LTS15_004615 [Exophiala xenobiotica]